ncbi:MAG: hypothetical protein IJY50_08985 [Clostridia bacterium]|nr:hypothetical protein [Clostridia bacterium]
MNEFSTYEFVVEQKLEGKWILARIALLCFYVFYVLGFLLLGLRYRLIVPLIALIPISLWIIVFITWRYVDVEYEYSITSGELTFSKIYGNRSRRRLLVVTLRDAVTIAPLDGDIYSAKATAWKPEREYSAISSLSAPDIYYMLFEYKDHSKKEKRRAILYFEATQRALQICRFYNPSGTVVTKTQR